MGYITLAELSTYKNGYDLSGYTDTEKEAYIELATELIDDYIGYSINYDPVIDEQGTTILPPNNQLFINVKSTYIDEVTDIKINTYGSEYVSMNIDYLNLFQKPGYLYVPLTEDFYELNRRIVSETKINYKISYTKEDKGIPNKIKLACSKIIGNLFRADYNLDNGITGSDKTIQSFTSGDYTVKLGGSSLSYKGKYSSIGGASDNPYIDDGVKALLYKLKRTDQNTY